MPKVFINYRIKDSQQRVDLIFKEIDSLFDKASVSKTPQVFQDSQNIKAGQEWATEIKQALSIAGIVLVVIGKEWKSILRNRNRKSRLPLIFSGKKRAKKDWVVWEIETAILLNKKIIPVLVGNASFPELKRPAS